MMVLGLDAASQRTNFGWALGRYAHGRVVIEDSGVLSRKGEPDPLATVIAPRLRGEAAWLVAIDAPLGWPELLAARLRDHRAGMPIGQTAAKNSTFRRVTDTTLVERGFRQPLEVGADRIARAAFEGLAVLAELGSLTGGPLPLAWSAKPQAPAVIEVYPAATLAAHAAPASRYKAAADGARRSEIAAQLAAQLPGLEGRVDRTGDEFDACLCLLAAADFLGGHAVGPRPAELVHAEREGWIWVRNRKAGAPG